MRITRLWEIVSDMVPLAYGGTRVSTFRPVCTKKKNQQQTPRQNYQRSQIVRLWIVCASRPAFIPTCSHTKPREQRISSPSPLLRPLLLYFTTTTKPKHSPTFHILIVFLWQWSTSNRTIAKGRATG